MSVLALTWTRTEDKYESVHPTLASDMHFGRPCDEMKANLQRKRRRKKISYLPVHYAFAPDKTFRLLFMRLKSISSHHNRRLRYRSYPGVSGVYMFITINN